MQNKIMFICLLYHVFILPSQIETPLSYAQITVANIAEDDLNKIKTQHQYDILKNYSNTIEKTNNIFKQNRAWRATEYSWSSYPQSQGYIDPKIASPEFFNTLYAIYESNFTPQMSNSYYTENVSKKKIKKNNGSF